VGAPGRAAAGTADESGAAMDAAEWSRTFQTAKDQALAVPEIAEAGSRDELAAVLDAREEQMRELSAGEIEAIERVDRSIDVLRSRLRVELAMDESPLLPAGAEDESTGRLRRRIMSVVRSALRTNPEYQALLRRRAAEHERLVEALVHKCMLPELRSWSTARAQDARETRAHRAGRYRAPLSIPPDTVLRGDASDQLVHEDTRSRQMVRTMLGRLRQGSIGLAGPRGCGKSTILALECSGSTPLHLKVCVAAPADYVPREFLLFLYRKVCEEVLACAGITGTAARAAPSPARRRMADTVRFLVLPVLAGAAGLFLILQFAAGYGVSAMATAAPVALSLVTAGLGYAATIRQRRRLAGLLREQSRHSGDVSPEAWRTKRRADAWLSAIAYPFAVASVILTHASGAFAWLDARRTAGALLLITGLVVLVARFALPGYTLRTRYVAKRGMDAAASSTLLFGTGLLLPAAWFAPDAPLIAGSALLAFGTTVLAADGSWRTATTEIESPPAAEETDSAAARERIVIEEAREGLARLRLQRSVASGWTSGVKVGASAYLPAGLESSVTGTTTETELPWTTPDVVDRIRAVLALQTDSVVGIDELDKIESEEKARAFLNEVKAVFSAPNTRFLVSMSEDAIASFDRRGLPFRDVFDSAFDEVVRVSYLTYEESRTLVVRRAGEHAPPPFIAFAHCLSGGLARDLIRAVDHMAMQPDRTLDGVKRAVVHAEMEAKYLGTRAALRPVPLEPQVTEIITALYRLDRCPRKPGAAPTPARCLQRPEWLAGVTAVDLSPAGLPDTDLASLRTVQRLAGEYLTFAYLGRTLLESFTVDDAGLERLWPAEDAEEDERISLDYLARARQHLTVNPHLAWEQITKFRKETAGLEPEDFPANLLHTKVGELPLRPG
jgi:hypothetical protein